MEDRDRHKWNCVPVMVTEIEGMGRGLVAARNIKKGELIFIDKPMIRLDDNGVSKAKAKANFRSLKRQIDALPIEAKKQWEKLNIPDDPEMDSACKNMAKAAGFGRRDMAAKELIARRFFVNSRSVEGFPCLYLNVNLINHSCAPNAILGLKSPDQAGNKPDGKLYEVRAMKDISRGKEITYCYPGGKVFRQFGFSREERLTGLYKECRFHCKCCVCSGDVQDQEDIMKEVLKLYETVDCYPYQKNPTEWRREAKTFEKIFELYQKLYIGNVVEEKMELLRTLAIGAQLARDEDFLEKAMETLKKEVEETNLEEYRIMNEEMKASLAMWRTELKDKKPVSIQEFCIFLKIKL